jgi:hypothetical protein
MARGTRLETSSAAAAAEISTAATATATSETAAAATTTEAATAAASSETSATTTATAAAAATTTPSASTAATAADTLGARWLRQKSGQRQQLGRVNEELRLLLEGFGLHIVLQLNGDIVLAYGAENLVNFANLLLVLQIDGSVKVGHVLDA